MQKLGCLQQLLRFPASRPLALEEGRGTDVAFTEVAKAPVFLDGLDETVVVVLRVVNRGNLLRGQGTSEENGINRVT